MTKSATAESQPLSDTWLYSIGLTEGNLVKNILTISLDENGVINVLNINLIYFIIFHNIFLTFHNTFLPYTNSFIQPQRFGGQKLFVRIKK